MKKKIIQKEYVVTGQLVIKDSKGTYTNLKIVSKLKNILSKL